MGFSYFIMDLMFVDLGLFNLLGLDITGLEYRLLGRCLHYITLIYYKSKEVDLSEPCDKRFGPRREKARASSSYLLG